VRSAGEVLGGAGLLFLSAAAAAAVVGTGVGCNQLFGFENRVAGPTWCEEDAQVSSSIYCDDFDRVSQVTQHAQLQITLGGTVAVTNAESSSPPKSLLVTTTTGDAGTLVGTIATLGAVAAGQAVECQIDVPTADLAALAAAGPPVGIFGMGAEEGSASGAIDLLVVFLDPTEETVALERATASAGAVAQQGMACPIPGGLGVTQALGGPAGDQNGWVRLTMAVAPTDGGVPEGGCVLDSVALAPTMDGGVAPTMTVRLAAGPLAATNIYVPAQDFAAAEYFTYGLAFPVHTPASMVHVDNARCQLIPSLP
jgi:hypothetical protein